MGEHGQIVDDKADLVRRPISTSCMLRNIVVANLRCLSLGKASSVAEESKLGNISGSVGAIFVHQACCSPAYFSKVGVSQNASTFIQVLGS